MATARGVATPPLWQTGAALESRIDAFGAARINIANLVAQADTVEIMGGLQEWTDFDGEWLDITEAPILRKDTEFRFKFRATNADGSRDEFYTLTVNGSRLIWLHSTLFFRFPSLLYESGRVTRRRTTSVIREMTDNDYKTFSTQTDVDVNVVDTDGNPTKIDVVGIIHKNVDRYSFTPTGGSGNGFSNRDVPASFKTLDGRVQSRTVFGLQWEFYPLPAQVTATSVRLQFDGTNIEIYEIFLLELLLEIPDGDFLDILPDKVDRAGRVLPLPNGSVDKVDVLGAERWKWETQYLLKIGERRSQKSVLEFKRFLATHTHIFHAQEPARYPNRMHPAIQAETEIPEELEGQSKESGYLVPFTVAEV